jgi:uncharacterized protein YndB with AHSA1/START domain
MTKVTPRSSDSLVFECDFEEPPEKVWRALTDPELLREWLSGGDHLPADSPEERAVPYEILRADPHRLLRYRWRDREGGVGESADREVHSVVTVELIPGTQGGTHLRLTHGEFRIVSAVPPLTAGRVRPIAGARRRTPTMSFAAPRSLRRAA